MIRLDLTSEEREIVADVLENYLSELRMEIADTDRKAFRDMLKQRKQTIRKVLDVLRPPHAAAGADVPKEAE